MKTTLPITRLRMLVVMVLAGVWLVVGGVEPVEAVCGGTVRCNKLDNNGTPINERDDWCDPSSYNNTGCGAATTQYACDVSYDFQQSCAAQRCYVADTCSWGGSGSVPTATPVPGATATPTKLPGNNCTNESITIVVKGDGLSLSPSNKPTNSCVRQEFSTAEADLTGCNISWSCSGNGNNAGSYGTMTMCSDKSCPIKIKGVDSKYTGCNASGDGASASLANETCEVASKNWNGGATVTVNLTKPVASSPNPTCDFSSPLSTSFSMNTGASTDLKANSGNATSAELYYRQEGSSGSWTQLGSTETGTNPSITRNFSCTAGMAGKTYQVACNASNATKTCTGNPTVNAPLVNCGSDDLRTVTCEVAARGWQDDQTAVL
jgi:hypothetical protein